MTQKLQISIYKIEDGQTLDDLGKLATEKKFIEQSLAAESKDGFDIKLYYQNKTSYPKWKGFAESVAAVGEKILQKDKSWIEGFVLLLSKNDKIYAVTGGHGHFVIQDCINRDFGIDVFARLIKRDDKILKSAREKSLVGGVMGTTKFFRKNFNLFDNDSFGKIYQELKASLDKPILIDKLGFTKEDIEKDSLCVAKPSFRINKDISFEQLLKLVDGCESILETADPVLINSVEKLLKKKDKSLIDKLHNELIKQLWQRYSQPQDSVDFDLCAYDLEKYLTASYYEVSRGAARKNAFDGHNFEILDNADLLFDRIKLMDNRPHDQAAFEKLIRNLKISSYNEDGDELTYGNFLDHLLGDVQFEDKRYFLVDRTWYLIKDEFIASLNAHCANFIAKNLIGMKKTWPDNLNGENEYNQQYIGENNTIVLDKITPENIEPCDILSWDENNLYFYHVKIGFSNTMRDLCSQISIAANKIQQDFMADKAFIKKIYQSLKDKIGGDAYFDKAGKQTNNISEEMFVKLFDKNLIFVLAVLDSSKKSRDIRDIKEFGSNIAKFSLQELSKDILRVGVDLKIAQIFR